MKALLKKCLRAIEGAISIIQKKPTSLKSQLVGDIREVSSDLESAYNRFENAADGDLIEASIFEIEALKARYRYLIKAVKAAE